MSKLTFFLPPFRQLYADRQGVAAVEFALLAPLLVLIFFGVVEVSNLLLADMKSRTAASIASDLITQDDNNSVSAPNLNETALAVQRIIHPLPSARGVDNAVMVTVYRTVATPSGTTTSVRWSRILPNQTAPSLDLSNPPCNDSSGLPVDLRTTTNDVARVQSVYKWKPWFSNIFNTSPITLRSQNYNMPRYTTRLMADASIGAVCP